MAAFRKFILNVKVKCFFCLMFLLFIINSFSQNYKNTIIISDLDDTYKITNSSHALPAIWHAFLTTRSFSGFPLLYNNFEKNGAKVIILTKSYGFLKGRVDHLFKKDNFQPAQLIMRHGFPKDFKLNIIRDIIKKNPSDKLILIGDDVSQDPFIYEEIARQYPGKVIQIYIRVIKKKKLPKSSFTYVSAYDIACNEAVAKRLSIESAIGIGNVILSTNKKDEIIPRFIHQDQAPSVNCDCSQVELLEQMKKKCENFLK